MKVGFLGLGAMGSAMAKNLLQAGNELHVWNRTASRAEPLAELGARVAQTPRDLAGVEAALAMFADDDAFRASVFDSGLFDALEARTVFVNLATVSVALARETAQRFAERSIPYVAAPVLGRPDAAAAAKLNILAAGDDAAIARVAPLLDVMGQKTFRIGSAPADANVVKIAANFMIVSAIETMAEAFALARGNGVEPSTVLEIISNTIFPAPIYKNYGAQIVEERFDPGFRLVLGLKDVRLALAAGEAAHTPLPFASLLRDSMLEAIAAGDGERDWTAIARVVQRRAGQLPVPSATERVEVRRTIAGAVGVLLGAFAPATSTAQPQTNAPVNVRVVGQWVTPSTFPDDLQVAHVRVRITTQIPVDVRAADFAGTVGADGGGTEILSALTWPSPGYENDGLIGAVAARPDVDPPEDFGALGRLHLDAGAQAVTTLSFELPFAVSDSQPMRSISYLPIGP